MKLIIAGSRHIFSPFSISCIEHAVHMFNLEIITSEVVSGCCAGVDAAGEVWATLRSKPIKKFPADWTAYGKVAGPMRNKEMAKYSDSLLLIWDGESKGSNNMRDEMKKLDKPIYELIVKLNEVI